MQLVVTASERAFTESRHRLAVAFHRVDIHQWLTLGDEARALGHEGRTTLPSLKSFASVKKLRCRFERRHRYLQRLKMGLEGPSEHFPD